MNMHPLDPETATATETLFLTGNGQSDTHALTLSKGRPNAEGDFDEWLDQLSSTVTDLWPGLEAPGSDEPDDMPSPPLEAYANEFVEDHGSARTSRFYSAATLKGSTVPPREWVVQDLIPRNTVTLYSGDGGAGKSLTALQLVVAVVALCAWMGRSVAHGKAIYLTAEDDNEELHRRLDDILRATGRGYDDIAGLTLRSLAGEDALLAVETQIAMIQSALFKELDQRAADDAPALIVIDTLADVYPANENDRAKVRQFVGILRGRALRHKCAVLLLGHPSLTGLSSGSGSSGSTAWNNSVRSRLYLSRIVQDGYEPDPDKRVLTTKKANYGRIGDEIAMTWRDGVSVPDEQPQGPDRMAMGGNKIIMHPAAVMMIHEPSALAVGPAGVMRQTADTLDKMSGVYATAYARATGNPVARVLEWMRSETWMTADEAVALNFADEIEGNTNPTMVAAFDYSRFTSAPANLVKLASQHGWATVSPDTGTKEKADA